MQGLKKGILLCFLLALGHSAQADDDEYLRIVEADYPGRYALAWHYTREDMQRGHPSKVVVQGKPFLVPPSVKAPTINSLFLLEHSTVHAGEAVLDMGTGSGLHAVFAAQRADHVVATDIDPVALESARFNAHYNGVGEKIDFRLGDLFGDLRPDERFDVVFFNIAYPFGEATLSRWKLHERFFAGVKQHLEPGGRIYYQVGFIRNIPYILDMLRRNGLSIMRMEMINAVRYGTEPILMTVQAD